MKILIVEDDALVAKIYRTKLVGEGFDAQVAHDGESALQLAASFQPDLMLLDLMLPKVPGIEVIKRIRAQAAFAKMPIIVLSNTYLTSMVQEAWKAGATKCLSKSTSTPAHVLEAIRQIAGDAARQSESDAESGVSPEVRKAFLDSLPAALTALRTSLQGVIKAADEAAKIQQLGELHRRVRALAGNAGVSGMARIAHLSNALEALIKELIEKPKTINASTLRTVANALDCLGTLFAQDSSAGQEMPAARVLVVDDEAISRRALTQALDRAKLKSVNVGDPLEAFQMASNTPFDLIFLDVDMPNMNGHELCSKLRATTLHARTPVVFVTGLVDFENRANSMMSGGNDFIAKPFLFIELAVKALVHLLRSQPQAAAAAK